MSVQNRAIPGSGVPVLPPAPAPCSGTLVMEAYIADRITSSGVALQTSPILVSALDSPYFWHETKPEKFVGYAIPFYTWDLHFLRQELAPNDQWQKGWLPPM